MMMNGMEEYKAYSFEEDREEFIASGGRRVEKNYWERVSPSDRYGSSTYERLQLPGQKSILVTEALARVRILDKRQV